MKVRTENLLSDDEIKNAELEMLIAFDDFARSHSIKYSLAYGTLLGAVRHKGFIPWDDDIDVIVPRPDYDRLIKMGQEGQTIDGFLMTGYDIDKFPMPFIKMIDPSIKVEDSATRNQIPLWLWIDIFPLDGCTDDRKEYAKLDKKIYFCKSIIKSANYKFFKAGKTPIKRLAKMIIKPIVYVFKLNYWAERYLASQAKKTPSYEDAQFVSNLSWGAYRLGEMFPKSWFLKTTEVEFENHMFPALAEWDLYLHSIYGDYSTLPPLNRRVAHGVTAWRVDSGQ